MQNKSTGIIEQFRKKKEEGTEHSVPPPKGLTLAEILDDKKSSHLLGKILEQDGNDLLAQKIGAGKFEQDDIELLEEARLKYQEKIEISEGVEKLLTEETVVEIARNHPDFAKIINLVGPKKAIRAIRSQLREICITDEKRFNAIAEPLKDHDNYKKGEYKKTEEAVAKLCKDRGISPEEYTTALAIEDPDEKEAALKKLVKGKYGKFEKVINVISLGGVTRSEMGELREGEASLEDALAKMNEYQEAIGDVLFASVSGNEDMRDALARELVGERAPAAEPEVGFGDAKKDTSDALWEANFDTDWETRKKDIGYDQEGPAMQEYIKEAFIDEQKEKYAKKTENRNSFWHRIFAAMLGKKIENKKNTLK